MDPPSRRTPKIHIIIFSKKFGVFLFMDKWPHSPIHFFNEKDTYMVTRATLDKEHLFNERKNDLDFLQELLLDFAI